MVLDQGFLGGYLVVTCVPYVAVFEISLHLIVTFFVFSLTLFAVRSEVHNPKARSEGTANTIVSESSPSQ